MNDLKEAREIATEFAAEPDYAPESAEELSDRIFKELLARHPKPTVSCSRKRPTWRSKENR
jgi:hypothetical protein